MNLFNILNGVAIVALLIYNLLHFKQKKTMLGGVSQAAIRFFEHKNWLVVSAVLKTAAFWVVLETLLISCAQYIGIFNSLVGNLLKTGANYFGMLFFAPLLVVLVCILLRIDPLAQLDLITPAYPLALFFSKIACHFAGCCRGIPWENGLYNPVSRMIEFPAQLLEAGVALLLFVFLLCCKNRLKKGTVFPVYLTMFSAIRFFTEFTRCEPAVFMGLKIYHILCLVGVLVGVVEYIFVCKYTARKEVAACGKIL